MKEQVIAELSQSLREVQANCIGLFRPNKSDTYELVIDRDGDGTLYCITVGKLLGLSQLTIHKSQGNLLLFPDGMTMARFMKEPFKFNEWCLMNCVY